MQMLSPPLVSHLQKVTMPGFLLVGGEEQSWPAGPRAAV